MLHRKTGRDKIFTCEYKKQESKSRWSFECITSAWCSDKQTRMHTHLDKKTYAIIQTKLHYNLVNRLQFLWVCSYWLEILSSPSEGVCCGAHIFLLLKNRQYLLVLLIICWYLLVLINRCQTYFIWVLFWVMFVSASSVQSLRQAYNWSVFNWHLLTPTYVFDSSDRHFTRYVLLEVEFIISNW